MFPSKRISEIVNVLSLEYSFFVCVSEHTERPGARLSCKGRATFDSLINVFAAIAAAAACFLRRNYQRRDSVVA